MTNAIKVIDKKKKVGQKLKIKGTLGNNITEI